MRALSGLVIAGLLALGGCSGDSSSPEAEPSEAPQATAPSEALDDVPSVRPRTDARILLGPDGDLELLMSKVESDALALTSVHAQDQSPEGTMTFDVDTGRCSGVGTRAQDGATFDFVSTDDGRMLVETADQPGRWVEAGESVVGWCQHGPAGVIGSNSLGFAAFSEPDRIGVERIDGQRATRFRSTYDGVTVDSWIAADGAATRVLKIVETRDGQVLRTLELSEFDSADPVAPVPS